MSWLKSDSHRHSHYAQLSPQLCSISIEIGIPSHENVVVCLLQTRSGPRGGIGRLVLHATAMLSIACADVENYISAIMEV